MATQVQKLENRFPQRVMQADSIFEFVVGTALILDSASLASWLGVSATLLTIVGVSVLAYGAWLLYLAQRNLNRQTLQLIAVFNLAWVVFSAALLVVDWNTFTNEGRWLISGVADISLVFGLVELYARRFIG